MADFSAAGAKRGPWPKWPNGEYASATDPTSHRGIDAVKGSIDQVCQLITAHCILWSQENRNECGGIIFVFTVCLVYHTTNIVAISRSECEQACSCGVINCEDCNSNSCCFITRKVTSDGRINMY